MPVIDKIGRWLDDRTGVPGAVKTFLDEKIPASSGWHQVFGSVAAFLFLVQGFTGILLAVNYTPAPGDAYESLRYILTAVTGGRLIHGLHHWGASMMVVVVMIHMAQVFLWGAYKKPREATWLAGVLLLLLTLAFALTGYLLPWDNRAYWGTVVTTQISASIPLAGPYLAQLLGSSDGVGVLTFARFYSAHVVMLPPITILLIGLHIYLVRRHGVAAAPEDELRVAKKFYPRQVLIDSMAIWLAFVLLFIMAVVVHVPLERLADPNDVVYVPRPEWYFLFLFQLLKFFSGPLEVFGSVILPSLAILLLILVPFIDRAPVIRITQRTVAMLFAGLFVLGWAALTGAAVKSTPSANAAESVDYSLPTEWLQCSPAELASVAAIRREKCGSCHVRGGKGPAGDLGEAGRERLEEWIATHVGEHGLKNSGEGRQLGKLLSRPTPRFKEAVQFAPDFAVQGAQVFQANGCFSCHEVNGAGRPIGPSLLGLFRRRSEAWILEHFANPQKMSPGTIMPPYHFPEIDARQLSDYLRSLPN